MSRTYRRAGAERSSWDGEFFRNPDGVWQKKPSPKVRKNGQGKIVKKERKPWYNPPGWYIRVANAKFRAKNKDLMTKGCEPLVSHMHSAKWSWL